MRATERGAIITAPVEEAHELLETRRDGLTAEEAEKRLEEFGRNEVESAKAYPVWKIVVDQVASPLIYVLIAAGIVTLLLRDYKDSAVIFAVVILNGVIGFIQEYRASRAIEALRALEAPQARVRRDGSIKTIPSAEAVPGDIILLEAGTRVAADIRLLRATELKADESLLTGESLPVDKTHDPLEDESADLADTLNFVYSGTMLVEGRGEGVVVYTGPRTELGKIAKAVSEVKKVETPLQHRLHKLANQITAAILLVAVVMSVIGWLQGMELMDIGLAAVALAVAAIPEALPVVVTVGLSIGVKRMADRQALVRKLPAVETMGSTEVIATDKTGTLTENRMTVRSVIWGPWHTEVREDAPLGCPDVECLPGFQAPEDEELAMDALHDVMEVAVFCNNSEYTIDEKGQPQLSGNPTEVALLAAAAIMAPHLLHEEEGISPISEVPFSSARKFMATVHRLSENEEMVLFAKGSPEVILERCDWEWTPEGPEELDRESWLEAAALLARQGERVIGLASKDYDTERVAEDDVTGMTFLGLMGIIDPPREAVPQAVADCQQAGIRVVMITGDHPATARAIGEQVGISRERPKDEPGADVDPTLADDPRVMTGRELDAASDEELAARIDEVDVYARVTPAHKLRIVKQFQEQGNVVAVTGDGVNDAPALRRAHIGISMGKSGTDAAREASDVVLLDDSFTSIFEAVKQGRYVFENIRKVTFFLISSGIAQIIAVLTFVIVWQKLPLMPAMILWVNLVANGLQDVALAFEPGEKSVLRSKPHGLRAAIFDAVVLQHTIVVGLVFGGAMLAGYWLSTGYHEAMGYADGDMLRAKAMTAATTTMVMIQMLHAFSCRSLSLSIVRVPLLNNKFLFISTVIAVSAHLAFVYLPAMNFVFHSAPIALYDWGVAVGLAVVGVFVMEISKYFIRRRHPHAVDDGWDTDAPPKRTS